MNGPEHFKESERLLKIGRTETVLDDPSRTNVFIQALAHATLALVAATVRRGPGDNDWALALRGRPSEGSPK